MMRSGTMPTIVSHGSLPVGRIRLIWWPMGSTPGKCVCAHDSLMIATGVRAPRARTRELLVDDRARRAGRSVPPREFPSLQHRALKGLEEAGGDDAFASERIIGA